MRYLLACGQASSGTMEADRWDRSPIVTVRPDVQSRQSTARNAKEDRGHGSGQGARCLPCRCRLLFDASDKYLAYGLGVHRQRSGKRFAITGMISVTMVFIIDRTCPDIHFHWSRRLSRAIPSSRRRRRLQIISFQREIVLGSSIWKRRSVA
jgi:hypothetical protein